MLVNEKDATRCRKVFLFAPDCFKLGSKLSPGEVREGERERERERAYFTLLNRLLKRLIWVRVGNVFHPKQYQRRRVANYCRMEAKVETNKQTSILPPTKTNWHTLKR